MHFLLKTSSNRYISGISPACAPFNELGQWLGFASATPATNQPPTKMFDTSPKRDDALAYPLRNFGAAMIDAAYLTIKGRPTWVVLGF